MTFEPTTEMTEAAERIELLGAEIKVMESTMELNRERVKEIQAHTREVQAKCTEAKARVDQEAETLVDAFATVCPYKDVDADTWFKMSGAFDAWIQSFWPLGWSVYAAARRHKRRLMDAARDAS